MKKTKSDSDDYSSNYDLSDDEYFEYFWDSDMRMYESRLSNLDELKTIEETLSNIRIEFNDLYYRLMSGVQDQK